MRPGTFSPACQLSAAEKNAPTPDLDLHHGRRDRPLLSSDDSQMDQETRLCRAREGKKSAKGPTRSGSTKAVRRDISSIIGCAPRRRSSPMMRPAPGLKEKGIRPRLVSLVIPPF